MTTLTFTGSALAAIALGVAWFVTRLLAPHTGAHQLRRTVATPVRSAPEEGTAPPPVGAVPPTKYSEFHAVVMKELDRLVQEQAADDLAEAERQRIRDGEAVEPLPPTRIAPDIAAHFARREAGML